MAKLSLSPTEVEQYQTDGYVVCESLWDAEGIATVDAAMREMTGRLVAGEEMSNVLELEPEAVDGQRAIRRIYNPYDLGGAFRSLADDARLLDRIETLIGPNFNLQHSKLNMKPARVGSVVEWHQDLAYFPHTNDDLVTTLIYLDEATEENGCLQVLPGQHRGFLDHFGPDGAFAGMITEEIDEERFGKPRPLPAPAGSVIFMHCMLPHSSLPNRSRFPRRTLIFEYRAADSFPIYYGEMTGFAESKQRPLRGQPARFARFGGPPPLIPNVTEYRSLYELQERTKDQDNTAGESATPQAGIL
jgi:ectoine hydroxylase-related dioxygenase (phytanoyl-CoA dioxygenase family)